MWNAKITAVASDLDASVAKITIQYANTDGRTKEVTERVSEPDSIKKIALDGIRELERVDAINNLVIQAKTGDIDLSHPVPTQEQLNEQEYQQKRQELKTLKEDLDLGLVNQSEYDKALGDTLLLKS